MVSQYTQDKMFIQNEFNTINTDRNQPIFKNYTSVDFKKKAMKKLQTPMNQTIDPSIPPTRDIS